MTAPIPKGQDLNFKEAPVDSSAIAGIGYDPDAQMLYVDFHSGRRYAYMGVSQQRYQAFAAAESKGRYLNQSIKGVYPYRRLS